MISRGEARAIALAEILKSWGIDGDDPIILDEHTIERDFGWVFFYDSRKYQETQSLSYVIAGNAPILVNRFDGSLHFTGTALPVEDYIRDYERSLRGGGAASPEGEA